jgi:hypothetical protein
MSHARIASFGRQVIYMHVEAPELQDFCVRLHE